MVLKIVTDLDYHIPKCKLKYQKSGHDKTKLASEIVLFLFFQEQM